MDQIRRRLCPHHSDPLRHLSEKHHHPLHTIPTNDIHRGRNSEPESVPCYPRAITQSGVQVPTAQSSIRGRRQSPNWRPL